MNSLVFALIPLILSIGLAPSLVFGYFEGSPLDQQEDGVPLAEITCRGDRVLMVDLRGKPGCAFPEHVDELAEELGWTIIEKEVVEEPEEPKEMEIETDISKLNGQNWYDPQNRNLGFRNMDMFVQFPHEISKGSGPVHEFGSNLQDLSNLQVEYFDEMISLDEYLERSHTDAFLVLKDNDIVYEKYLRMDSDERHAIQSTSKTIVAALLGDYVEDGSIDLEKQTKEVFPDIGSGYAEATLQQVLDMDVSNNFSFDFNDPNAHIHEYEVSVGWKPDVENKWPDGHRGFIKTEITSDDVSSTGVSQYQDPNTDIGGWLLEEASGEKYYDLFGEKIYQHLGAEQDAMITLDNQGNAFAAGGWQMTLRDLARYASIWMNNGVAPDGERIFSEEWIAELRDPTKGVPYKGYEEYNVRYHNMITSGGPFLAHAGWSGQFLYADPDNKVAYVMFSSLIEPSGGVLEEKTAMYGVGVTLSEHFSGEVYHVDTFDECIADGNPAMESHPRQCRTPDGKHFVEEIN